MDLPNRKTYDFDLVWRENRHNMSMKYQKFEVLDDTRVLFRLCCFRSFDHMWKCHTYPN